MKLTHLEHIEDNLMLHPDSVRQTIRNMWSDRTNISLKWDGSPAIIFGTDPFTNQFFLSTKSFFNANPKINYSCEDIMKYHAHSYDLATTLMYVFTVLKNSYKSTQIVQADLLFTRGDIVSSGYGKVQFTPNTLTYQVSGEETNDCISAKIGIAIHTQYKFTDHNATSLQELVAFPYTRNDVMGSDVWLASVVVDTKVANLKTNHCISAIDQLIEARDEQFVKIKIQDTGVYDNYKIFYNNCIRNNDTETNLGSFSKHWKNFVDWTIDRSAAKVKKLKTAAGMKTHLYALDQEMTLLHDPKVIEHFKMFVIARDMVEDYKARFCKALQNESSAIAMYNGEQCSHEGYVVCNSNKEYMKIVNRREFSMRNFQNNN